LCSSYYYFFHFLTLKSSTLKILILGKNFPPTGKIFQKTYKKAKVPRKHADNQYGDDTP